MDPKQINTYNKFLSTLDQTSSINQASSINNGENNGEIDKLIEQINTNFITGNYSSINFTGQLSSDTTMFNILDPNYYNEPTKKNQKYKFYLKNYKNNEKNEEKIKIPEQFINIETELNNISDILKLIETYKVDPNIQYNINIKVLHDIKEPLEELNNMIGMKELKNNIVDQILYFAQELHKNKDISGDFMHTVIYGSPGTGKTELAKIMGKIYSKIGVLTKGTFKKVTRSDLIAGYLGQTALKTKDVIKEAIGGVLFIDEAYALGNPDKKDSFSKECIDTLCEALSDHKDDLMVIIAGYEHELKDCFFNYNQGLDSRFTWRFKTDEYTAEDLYQIFLKKVKDIGWNIDENSKITADWFKKNHAYFKFYGRDIETLLAKVKIAHSRRVFCKPSSDKKKINLNDLDKGLESYLKNEDIKNRKNERDMNKYLCNTLYC